MVPLSPHSSVVTLPIPLNDTWLDSPSEQLLLKTMKAGYLIAWLLVVYEDGKME